MAFGRYKQPPITPYDLALSTASRFDQVDWVKYALVMAKEILISEFKAHCTAELKRVHRTGQPLIVTLRGKPIARVESIRPQGEPAVKLGSKRGKARIKRDLIKFDFAGEWEMNR
jgi:prevent-host-death family protein